MLVILILFLIWLVVALLSRLSLLRVQAHWHGKNTVITQFSTPHNLTPAEFGYIFDRKFGRNEMKATIVDLFQRKLLILKSYKVAFANDIEISANPARPHKRPVDDCEAVLIAHIKYSHGGKRLWSEISSIYSRETGTRWQYEQAVVGQLIDKGYLTERAKNEPFVDRFIKSGLSFAVTWLLFFSALGSRLSGTTGFDKIDSFVSVLVLIPVFVIVWAALYIYLSVLSQEVRLSAGLPRFATEKLRSEWRDVVGFRDYLRVVEWHRLRSMPEIENKAVAYCLAAGFKVDVNSVLN